MDALMGHPRVREAIKLTLKEIQTGPKAHERKREDNCF